VTDDHNISEDMARENRPGFVRLLWRNKSSRLAIGLIAFLFLLGVLSPFLATDQPWYIQIEGQHFFPAFSTSESYSVQRGESTEQVAVNRADWKRMDYDRVWWAPIPYSPATTESKNGYLNASFVGPGDAQQFKSAQGKIGPMPGRFKHVFGTGKRGEDLLAGMIHGARVSLLVGFCSILIAALLGLTLGAVAGYLGDRSWRLHRGGLLVALVFSVFGFYYAFSVRFYQLADAMGEAWWKFLGALFVSLVIQALFTGLGYFAGERLLRTSFWSKRVYMPIDSTVQRTMEILHTVPRLIIILSVAALLEERSLMHIILIIGLTSWTGIARMVRAEILRIRELDYIQAARALGIPQHRIIFKHALPNAIMPATVLIAFGISSAILIETGLSFLGIGVGNETVSWGALLSAGREQFSAWWMVLFPGLAIFLTVIAFNLVGEGVREVLDPQNGVQRIKYSEKKGAA